MQREMADYLLWILRLSLSFISVTYSQFLSLSLFNSTSWQPAATGLLPQQRAAIIGIRSNTIGGEYCPGHIAVSSDCDHSLDCLVFPVQQLKTCSKQMCRNSSCSKYPPLSLFQKWTCNDGLSGFRKICDVCVIFFIKILTAVIFFKLN